MTVFPRGFETSHITLYLGDGDRKKGFKRLISITGVTLKGGISILINKREKGPIPIEAKTEEDDNASMKRTKRSNPFGPGLTIDRGIVPPDDITPIHSVVML